MTDADQNISSETEVANEDFALEARGLTRHYGKLKAISNVSFRLRKGEIVGFLGPNGAGKSTTMRILCGLLAASSGRVTVGGIELTRYPEKAARKIGYLPENNPLPEELTVKEYLEFRAKLKGLKGKVRKEQINKVMDLCDLQRKASKKLIRKLSKGFRQRVGIADALLAEPEIIILDEPTIGLDPHQLKAIRSLIDSLRGSMTVLLSSHILPEIEMVCDRALIINHGQIVARGRPSILKKEFIVERSYHFRAVGNVESIPLKLMKVDPEGVFSQTNTKSEGVGELLEWRSKMDDDLSGILLETLQQIEGLRVLEFYRAVPSLEDVFMAATRRVWETVTPEGDEATEMERPYYSSR